MPNISVVNLPETRVVGLLYHGKGSFDEVPKLWERLNKRYLEILPAGESHQAAYGISIMGDDFEESGEFDYIAGFPSALPEADLPEGMTTFTLPGGLYAYATCPDLAKIEEAFDSIYEQWLPGSAYGLDLSHGNICFEVYDERFDPSTGVGAFDVYAPVKEK